MKQQNEQTQYWTDVITERTATTVRLSQNVRKHAAWQHKADLMFELNYLKKEIPRVQTELRKTRKDDTYMQYRWTRRLARLQKEELFFQQELKDLLAWIGSMQVFPKPDTIKSTML